ncbi:MAG: hypothetical protein JXK93_03135 [Sphaerochaetaceae bacterium]|nr:hypothetical protein [Sphaerochaetaceae bacterium]
MNHTPQHMTDSPSQDTVTLTETSTMRELYHLLETETLPEYIALQMNGHSASTYIDREEVREFITPYILLIDTQMKAQFLDRLGQLSITPFIREENTLSHEIQTESEDMETLIASSF